MTRVSIGLPVYNGARYLQESIDSLLAQTFEDFELVICDNASTDDTEEICRTAAAGDPRILYIRNEANLGAALNYNLAFDRSRGEYFKWAAHDDVCAPEFLERAVRALDDQPEAVLAFAKVKVIDGQGEYLRSIENKLNTGDHRPSERFKSLLGQHVVTEVFGLIRRSALLQTQLIIPYPSADRMLLTNLALLGRFFFLDEPLFLHRDHDERSHKALKTSGQRASWFDPKLKNKRIYPAWRFVKEVSGNILRVPLPTGERIQCFKSVMRWCIRNRHRLAADFAGGR